MATQWRKHAPLILIACVGLCLLSAIADSADTERFHGDRTYPRMAQFMRGVKGGRLGGMKGPKSLKGAMKAAKGMMGKLPPQPIANPQPKDLQCMRADVSSLNLATGALDLIKQFAGWRASCFMDQSKGGWVIGYGHVCAEGASDSHCSACASKGVSHQITQVEALGLLAEDMREFEECVKSTIKVPLTANEYGALVSFAFGAGCGAFTGSKIVAALNAGNYLAVPGEFMRWAASGGAPNSALSKRRAAEATLFRQNGCANSGNASPQPAGGAPASGSGAISAQPKEPAPGAPAPPPPPPPKPKSYTKPNIPGAPSWYHYMSPWWMAPNNAMPKPDQEALKGVVDAPSSMMPYFNPYDSIMIETDSQIPNSPGEALIARSSKERRTREGILRPESKGR